VRCITSNTRRERSAFQAPKLGARGADIHTVNIIAITALAG